MYQLRWLIISFLSSILLFYYYAYGFPSEKVVLNVTVVNKGFDIPHTLRGGSKVLYYYDIKTDEGSVHRLYSSKEYVINDGLVSLDKKFSILEWQYIYELHENDY